MKTLAAPACWQTSRLVRAGGRGACDDKKNLSGGRREGGRSGFRYGRVYEEALSSSPTARVAWRRSATQSLTALRIYFFRPRGPSNSKKGTPMPKMIFVNLPVADLDASMAFYTSIGFANNPQFSDATTACMVWSEAINVMLHTHAKWRQFTSRPIPPATTGEVMLALTCDSREAVDAMNEAAAAKGGTADINPVQDLGFMYNRALADPDGHLWEAAWMNPAAIPSHV
jgi:uncharacterized protein